MNLSISISALAKLRNEIEIILMTFKLTFERNAIKNENLYSYLAVNQLAIDHQYFYSSPHYVAPFSLLILQIYY